MLTLWPLSHAILGTLCLDLTQVSVRLLEVELGIYKLQLVNHVSQQQKLIFKVMKSLNINKIVM